MCYNCHNKRGANSVSFSFCHQLSENLRFD
nr:MAG TPA: cytochrome c-553 [Caudoviricetes sp.]